MFSCLISVLYNKKELAIIALIGGFTSPFMVQGETENYVAFFTYIAIINAGMMFLSYFKKWNILLQLSLGFTVLFFGGWLIISNLTSGNSAGWAILFSSLFFIQFLGMGLFYNFIRKVKFNAWEFMQLTSITALYYTATIYILSVRDFNLTNGQFTLIMSLFFIALALFSFFRKGTDRSLTYLLIGKAVAFITLTGALLFEGNHMTLFWAVEAILLLVLGQYSKMRLLKNASIILISIAICGLINDWVVYYIYSGGGAGILLNSAFLTGLFIIGVLALKFTLVKKDTRENSFLIDRNEYHFTLGAFLFILSYFVVLFETIHQFDTYAIGSYTQVLIIGIYHLLYILIGFFIARFRQSELLTQIFFYSSCLGLAFYLMFIQANNIMILKGVFSGSVSARSYYLHYLLTFGIVSLILILRHFSKYIFEQQKNRNWFLTALSIIGMLIATFELDQIIGYSFGSTYGLNNVLAHSRNEGYTILWGVYSFLLMIRGMKKKNKVMRILALILFSITLLKLFVIDIREISDAGKIIAFISLGVLLLVVSFLYQKLKEIIVGE